MRYRYYTADVFTDHIFGGNQLAVFPDGRGLSAELMQQVARELNLSETVFVLPAAAPEHSRRLRIFTPGTELPFAGHPTLGTAHVLAAIGEIRLAGEVTRITFEEGVGPVPVAITAIDGQPVSAKLTAAKLPEFGPAPPPAAELAAMLSLDVADLRNDGLAPAAVSCGVPFLIIPVQDRGALRRASLDRGRWDALLSSFWAPHLYLVAADPRGSGPELHARMFAPAMGITEDPATGAAATALAGYLAARTPAESGTMSWVVKQGLEMGRPSILELEADRISGAIVEVRVGGSSVLVGEATMNIPT